MKSGSRKFGLLITIILPVVCLSQTIYPFQPITVISGYNHDVVAESGTSSLLTTTSPVDAVATSNKVLYTEAFRNQNGFQGGGLPDNGRISLTDAVFTLQNYSTFNSLVLPRGASGSLSLNVGTTARYDKFRLLAFSTEGASLINITLNYTDGTSHQAISNYTLPDWNLGSANAVIEAFGRCTRATPASGADGFFTVPRMFYIDIPVACSDRVKLISNIEIENVTTSGSNAPYPNAVIMAISGRPHFLNSVRQNIVIPTCLTTGTAVNNFEGSSGPWSLPVWNTVPPQVGTTATGLAYMVNYTATAVDAMGCTSTTSGSAGINNIVFNTPVDTTVCEGIPFTTNFTSNATHFNWSPPATVSQPTILNPVITPTVSTVYVISSFLGPCIRTKPHYVIVKPRVQLLGLRDTTICTGASFSAPLTPDPAATYSWSPATGVSNSSIARPVIAPRNTTTYTVTATKDGCSYSKSFTVNVIEGVSLNAGNDVTIVDGSSIMLQATASTGVYSWSPRASLSSDNILNPVASPRTTTTYRLVLESSSGCTAYDDVTVTVLPYCVKPMNAISPNGDGINDQWIVVNGNCTSSIRAKIFNRNGNLVYESLNYQNDWKGTYLGKPVPDGTYYYVLELKLVNGRTVPVKGDLTILR